MAFAHKGGGVKEQQLSDAVPFLFLTQEASVTGNSDFKEKGKVPGTSLARGRQPEGLETYRLPTRLAKLTSDRSPCLLHSWRRKFVQSQL